LFQGWGTKRLDREIRKPAENTKGRRGIEKVRLVK